MRYFAYVDGLFIDLGPNCTEVMAMRMCLRLSRAAEAGRKMENPCDYNIMLDATVYGKLANVYRGRSDAGREYRFFKPSALVQSIEGSFVLGYN